MPVAIRCLGPLLTAASTACSNRSHASGSVSMSSGFGFFGGFAMVHDLSLPALRKEAAEDIRSFRELYESIGLFFRYFGAAELQLDRLLAHIIKFRNFEKYSVLASGLDPRGKCDRLRAAAKIYQPLGPNLEIRLKYFEGKCIKMRNSLAHGRLVLKGKDILVTSLDKMPDAAPTKVRPRRQTPTRWSIDEIIRRGLWLRDFESDLDDVAYRSWQKSRPKKCEITSPRSSLPKAHKDNTP